MSLFQCSKCGCVENTALSNYWFQKSADKMCSACDGDGWHGKFKRIFLPLGEFITDRDGNLKHIQYDDTDYRKYEIEEPPNADR